MKRVVVPVSGGMDSAVLLFKAVEEADEVFCLIFDYGQRHMAELQCAIELISIAQRKKNAVYCKIVNMKFMREIADTSSLTNDAIETPNIRKMAGEAQPKSYVPFRNMLFLSTCLSHAEAVGATEVWHGATKVDSLAGYWDSSPEFLPSLNTVCSLNREHKINIVAPLISLDKTDIVKLGVDLKVPFQHTYTCYSGLKVADAETPSSSLRLQGFINAGFIDPQKYIQQEKLNDLYTKKGCKKISYIPHIDYQSLN